MATSKKRKILRVAYEVEDSLDQLVTKCDILTDVAVSPTLVNTVYKASVGHRVDLDTLVKECSYPCAWNGLESVRITLPKCRVLVLRTGHVVVAGLDNTRAIARVWLTVRTMIHPFAL